MKKDIRKKDIYVEKGMYYSTFRLKIPMMLNQLLPQQAEQMKALANEATGVFQSDLMFSYNSTRMNPYNSVNKAPQVSIIPKSAATKMQNFNNDMSNLFSEIENANELAKYPALKSFVMFYGELIHRSKDGDDISEILHRIPGGVYLCEIIVDFIGDIEDPKVLNDPKQLNDILAGLHFPEMMQTTLEYYDLIKELEDPQPSAEKVQQAIPRLKELNQKISGHVEHLMKDETAAIGKKLFVDYELNVRGNRGVNKPMRESANHALDALEQGWDPRYISDYHTLCVLSSRLETQLTFFRNQNSPETADMIRKIEAVLNLHPSKQMFYSAEEFVTYYQTYSTALFDMIEESKKPVIQNMLENTRIQGHILFREDSGYGHHGHEAPTLEYFANKMNLKNRGIAVEDGVLISDEFEPKQVFRKSELIMNYIRIKMERANGLFERIRNSTLSNEINPALEPLLLAVELGASVDRVQTYLADLIATVEDYLDQEPEKAQLARDITAFANDMKDGFLRVVPGEYDTFTPLIEQYEQAQQDLAGLNAEEEKYFKSFSAVPRKTRVDYRYLETVSKNLLPHDGVMAFILPSVDEVYANQEYENEILSFSQRNDFNNNHYEQYKNANRGLEILKERLMSLKNEKALQGKAGLQAYFDNNLRLLDDAQNGILLKNDIPGYEFLVGDLKLKTQINHDFGPDELNEMFTGMGFTDAWEHLSQRTKLEALNDKAALSAGEAGELKEQIKNTNNLLIADYEKMKSMQSEEKYTKFFQNFAQDVAGENGLDRWILELKEQNAMLDAGWDPARIADYQKLKQICELAKQTNAKLEELNRPELEVLRDYINELQELNPEGQIFHKGMEIDGFFEFDDYYANVSRVLSNVLAEGKKDAVRQALEGVDTNHTLLDAFSENEHHFREQLEDAFSQTNLAQQSFKGNRNQIEKRQNSIFRAGANMRFSVTVKNAKKEQLVRNLQMVRRDLYAKHRIGLGGASAEMTVLREKNERLIHLLVNDNLSLDHPKVIKAAKELDDAGVEYEKRKRTAANALNNDNWQPKTNMGKTRFAASKRAREAVASTFVFDKEGAKQTQSAMEFAENSPLKEQLNDIQREMQDHNDAVKDIAKVIALQIIGHEQEAKGHTERIPDTILEAAALKIMQSPGFKKMIPNPNDLESVAYIDSYAYALHDVGGCMKNYFRACNQANAQGPEEQQQQQQHQIHANERHM